MSGIGLKEKVDKETDCSACIHDTVCYKGKELRCINFLFGRSNKNFGCDQCVHIYRRDPVERPCFKCNDFNVIFAGKLNLLIN